MTLQGQFFGAILRCWGTWKDRFPRVSTSPVSQLYLASAAWIITRSVLTSTSPDKSKKEPSRRIFDALKPIDAPAGIGTAVEKDRLFEGATPILIGSHGSDPAVLES